MKKFSFNSIIKKQQPKGFFIEAIWKCWHRHLSISIVIVKKIIFAFRIFLKKNKNICFFLVLSYGISTTLLQILLSLRFPIRPFKGVHWCSRKRLFEHSEASIHWCFKKQLPQKFLHTLHTFQRNFQGGVLFKYTRKPSWNCSKKLLEQLFCRHGFISSLDVRYSAHKT